MDENKKILMISGKACYPPDVGNRRRIHNIILLMKQLGYQVDFLFHASERIDCEKQMKEFLGKEHFYYCKTPYEKENFFAKHSRGCYLERFVPPYSVDFKYMKEISEKVNSLIEKQKYDIVWMEYPHQSKVLDSINGNILKVIDTHDRFAYSNRKMFPLTHRLVDYSLSYRGERKALSRADVAVAIQKEEGKYFKWLLQKKRTSVVTIGDNHELVKNPVNVTHDICFIGSAYRPNIDAINWFIHEVFPIVQESVPDSRVVIVGKICGELNVKGKKNVVTLGCVEDIDEAYANCRLVVNPVRVGTGLNIKTIEAIAHCKPLVSTSVGAKGINYKKPVMAIANDKQGFAKKVICFLKDDSLCEKYGKHCAEFIEEYNRQNLQAMDKILNMRKRRAKQ